MPPVAAFILVAEASAICPLASLIALKIKSSNISSLAQKETQAGDEKMAILQKAFLADKGVQKLQQVFNTVINTNSIKEISKPL
jgi:hypothetical protein